ncbi:MAG: hypothetical protein HYX43_19385 [Burkholderiales bacterium]|nr:hypothetical protein [Burkholderiales bacterium]
MTSDIDYGALVLCAVVLLTAWHEYAAKNHRDAKLLALVGTAGLVGTALVWSQ